jgi:dGTPase
MLPTPAQRYIDKRGLERTVCDYIAGMTDRYAIEEYQKLFNQLEKP